VIFEELEKNVRARIRICNMCSAYSVPLSRHLTFTPVLAKHSMAFSLVNAISVGVDRLQRNFEPMRKLSNATLFAIRSAIFATEAKFVMIACD
jgi:hypothetical protein